MWKIIMLVCITDGRCYQQETFIPQPKTHETLELCMERLKSGGTYANVDAIMPPNVKVRYACVEAYDGK